MVQQSIFKLIYFVFSFLFWIIFSIHFLLEDKAHAANPMVRIKSGTSRLTVNAGEVIVGESLTPMVTFQPSVMWALPEISTRLGVHYLQDLGGSFGMTPVSGIGISGYYYLMGISTAYSVSEDETVMQKSRPGPYLFASLTPVNFNLNRVSSKFYFSAFIYDVAAGIGYDFPLTQNMIISLEYVLRNGISNGPSKDNVNYKGSTIFISFGTTYF